MAKEISDCCAMIFLLFKESSANDILKFLPDFIVDHLDNNKKIAQQHLLKQPAP